MKESKYNFEFQDSLKNYIIYNSVTEKKLKIGQRKLCELKDLASENDIVNLKKMGLLVEDNENEVLENKFNNSKSQTQKFSLIVSLCNNCNFACTYCYEMYEGCLHENETYMTEKTEKQLVGYIKNVIDKYEEIVICWFGGEPLLRFDTIKRLTNEINRLAENSSCKVTYEMVSNGYLLNKKVAKFFSNLNFSNIQITLDGNKQTHDNYRILKNGQGTFFKILKNIEDVCDLIRIVIRINVSRNNMESIKSLLLLLKERQLNKKVYVYFSPVEDFSEGGNEDVLSFKEFSDIHVSLVEYAKSLEFSQQTIADIHKCTYCGVNVESSFYVNYKGDLYKCEHLMAQECDSVGNIFGDINKTNLNKFLQYSPFKYKECLECKILPKCWGGCMFKREYIKRNKCPYWKYSYETLLNNKIF